MRESLESGAGTERFDGAMAKVIARPDRRY